MRKIYTHVSMDLDAACSVWLIRKFYPEMIAADLVLVPADWDGEGMTDEDIAVDLEAGGKGIKGKKGKNGITHSCFSSLLLTIPEKDRKVLAHLERLVDAQDAYGSAVKFLAPEINQTALTTFSFTGINAVFRALQASHYNDRWASRMMCEILNGMLKTGHSRLNAQQEADKAEIIDGCVAIVRENRFMATNGILFDERGIRIIIFVDGNNLGVIRKDTEIMRMDNPVFQGIVAAAGETEEWFAHTAGFLFCRGSRKSPAKSPSRVNPMDLALAATLLLKDA